MSDALPIITGTGLYKIYESGIISRQKTCAVRNVDISIEKGKTYALVGESGSGKSTLGKLLIHLISLTKGEIRYNGQKIDTQKTSDLEQFRRKMQIIPQHPEDALNPRWKVSYSVLEPYRIHKDIKMDGSKQEQLLRLLAMTGLNPDYANRYPHQLSGGELQRAVIARTLALHPEFIVCDEPTSMLDVSVQASIIQLLIDIQNKTGVALLFITHDIRLAHILGDRLGVMYRGEIVEEGDEITDFPMHPYSRMLCRHESLQIKQDSTGNCCAFIKQCPAMGNLCNKKPSLILYKGRKIQCHYPERLYKILPY